MTTQFQFKMQAGPTPGKIFELEGNVATIGREAGNAVIINDPEVSRKHVKLVLQGESYVIEDLGSTNGTFVNQMRLTGPYMLKNGDVISLGEQITLIFEVLTTDPNATMVSGMKPTPFIQTPSTPVPAPAPLPASTPITTGPAATNYNPESPPPYAGQIPVSASVPLEPPAKPANNTRTIVAIVIAAVVLCCLCGCIGLLFYIDAQNLWCDWAPFLVPLLGGACGG